MKLIIDRNPVIVLREFEDAVKQGYLFVVGRSDLFVEVSGLMQIDLYKQQIESPEITFEQELDIVYVSEYDKLKFILRIQALVLSGWEIDLNSINYSITGSKICKLVHPEHPVSKVYSKEDLDQMDFEELKAISRLRGCFNRQRSVLIANVLKFQEDRQ